MEYEWPCDKRKPHGEHEVPEGTCPGVRAHPNTMIGREPAPKIIPKEQDPWD